MQLKHENLVINRQYCLLKIKNWRYIYEPKSEDSTSTGDFEACKAISKLGLDSEVMGLARMAIIDIDKVIDADMDGIHLFIATSDIHLKSKLQMTREEVIEQIQKHISYAKEHYSTILFSAEDATRSDLDFLIRACGLIEKYDKQ